MTKRKNEIIIAKDKKGNKVVVINEIIFEVRMLVRRDADDKNYLCDFVRTKKENEQPV